jgi:excisionase family DNA binding protein
MEMKRDVLTTGQVAKICNVAPRTVSKWFDTGQLRGYRIPGSKDRRIPREQLIRFMRAHGMPLDGLETGRRRVLIVDPDADLAALLARTLSTDFNIEVKTAASAFEAGTLAESFRPQVMIIDVSLGDLNARQLCHHLRSEPHLQNIKLVATSGGMTDGMGQGLLQDGFSAYLAKPFEIRPLVKLIEETAEAMS